MAPPAWAGAEETETVPADQAAAIGAVGTAETVDMSAAEDTPSAEEPPEPQLPPPLRDVGRVQPLPRFHELRPVENRIAPVTEGYIDVDTVMSNAVAELQVLDPVLLADPDTVTGRLIGAGIEGLGEVTIKYGSPERPLWGDHADGHEIDFIFPAYHNGGEHGHTSLNRNAAGVPYNTLWIDHAINRAAGREIRTAQDRAEGFVAAVKHDKVQYCGRTLLPEGQDHPNRGDERISAEQTKDELLAEGVSEAAADRIARRIMATAFNPEIGGQNVDYSLWHANRDDPAALKDILGQEITAAADLFGTTGPYGEVGAWLYVMETLTMRMKDNITEERLAARGVDPLSIKTPTQMMAFIARDKILRGAFNDGMQGQVGFFKGFRFSDEAIRTATGGIGIDQLSPGRNTNAIILQRDLDAFKAARRQEDRMVIWHGICSRAGLRI
jgi:hypothetical protein